MLARFNVFLPYQLTIPNNAALKTYEIVKDEYKIRFLFPQRSSNPPSTKHPEKIKIDDQEAFGADTLVIEFQKSQFDRSKNILCDPPESFVEDIVNWFLNRVRLVSNATNIYPVNLSKDIPWELKYLTDEGQELPIEEHLCRGRYKQTREFSYAAVTTAIWDDVFNLPQNFEIPLWKTLLLDAGKILSDSGPAIVLAYSALEVFINEILNLMAANSKLSPQFWTWLKQDGPKGDYRKAPSTSDKFDMLLKELSGTSLKSNPMLWEKFKDIHSARNNFVHKGKLEIGRKNPKPINNAEIQELITYAYEIMNYIREFIPDELKWPLFNHQFKGEIELLFPQKTPDNKAA